MDPTQFSHAVSEARKLVEGIEEPFMVAAFQVALSRILAQQAGYVTEEVPQPLGLSRKSMSYEEFAAKLPRSASHNDRFVAAAYYLAQSGVAVFRANEILEEYYPRARWVQRPRNSSDVANQCAKKAYFELTGIDDKGMKLWRITRTGIEYVENQLLVKSEEEK